MLEHVFVKKICALFVLGGACEFHMAIEALKCKETPLRFTF